MNTYSVYCNIDICANTEEEAEKIIKDMVNKYYFYSDVTIIETELLDTVEE